MFIIGTATWTVMMTITRSPIYEEIGPAYWILMNIIALLGIPAPFMMFFGSIMVIARFFPYLMKILSDFLWKIEGGVNAFAIRNVVRHKQAANRAVLLITLALAFSILASSLIFSMDESRRLDIFYHAGADFVVSTGESANNTILHIIEENISQISDISHVYDVVYTGGRYYSKTYHCLFVDPYTYAQVAIEESYYQLSKPLDELTEKIADNRTIILFDGNLDSLNAGLMTKKAYDKPIVENSKSFFSRIELAFHLTIVFSKAREAYNASKEDLEYIILEAKGDWGSICPEGTRLLVFLNIQMAQTGPEAKI